MSVASFIPEYWSAKLQVSLKKNLVYAGPTVVNRDYEGEISQAGDTVHINSISRPTIATYTPNSTSMTAEQLNTAQRSLVVDQAKYFDFYLDDVDKRQAAGDILPEAVKEAAYGLADAADQYVVSLYTGAASANALGTIAVPTGNPEYFYDKVLVPLSVALDEANVPAEGRWCVVPPWLHGRALRDSRFVKVNESGTEQGLRNGIIGRSAGFDILKSNNAPLVTGDDYAVMAGYPGAISFASQILETEALRSTTAFADQVRGLSVYGAKLVRPTGIATAVVSQT